MVPSTRQPRAWQGHCASAHQAGCGSVNLQQHPPPSPPPPPPATSLFLLHTCAPVQGVCGDARVAWHHQWPRYTQGSMSLLQPLPRRAAPRAAPHSLQQSTVHSLTRPGCRRPTPPVAARAVNQGHRRTTTHSTAHRTTTLLMVAPRTGCLRACAVHASFDWQRLVTPSHARPVLTLLRPPPPASRASCWS
jgi:hypothetical protein